MFSNAAPNSAAPICGVSCISSSFWKRHAMLASISMHLRDENGNQQLTSSVGGIHSRLETFVRRKSASTSISKWMRCAHRDACVCDACVCELIEQRALFKFFSESLAHKHTQCLTHKKTNQPLNNKPLRYPNQHRPKTTTTASSMISMIWS
mmetsp:Transcript_7659/g.28693  ORF Transcript_7659/g.28693 Transcript_7659/m.28693 type:complete len:151 (-) Transcript_7659:1308-1760(-)